MGYVVLPGIHFDTLGWKYIMHWLSNWLIKTMDTFQVLSTPCWSGVSVGTLCWMYWPTHVNTLRPRQNGRNFPNDIFKCIFLNKNIWISINMSLKFVAKGPINIIPSLVQIIPWHRAGDKPLSEPMVVRLPTHICVTRPHWVQILAKPYFCIYPPNLYHIFNFKVISSIMI